MRVEDMYVGMKVQPMSWNTSFKKLLGDFAYIGAIANTGAWLCRQLPYSAMDAHEFFPDTEFEPYKEEVLGVSTSLIPGEEYYVSDKSMKDAYLMKEKRVYICDIGHNHYFVASGAGNTKAYPHGCFDSVKWRFAIPIQKEEPVTELTVNEVADLLRKNNIIKGKLKIKEQ